MADLLPGLTHEWVRNALGDVRLIVHDTDRACHMQWRVNTGRLNGADLSPPLKEFAAASINGYFTRMRKMHPESYLTCECHKQARQGRA
jgi:hypothetical protein